MIGHISHTVFLIFLLFLTVPATAQPASALFKKYKSAVVKIVIKQHGIPVGSGSGFFISQDGRLITNHHVVRSAMRPGSFTLDFVLSNNRTLRDFSVAACGDDRGLDLCLLKLPVQPKQWFRLASKKPAPGEKVYVIGHPQGLDFSMTDGIVSGLRTGQDNVGILQITAAISPGSSGGPIFDDKGQVVGAATMFLKDGQSLNFGILATEISNLVKRSQRFQPIAEYRKTRDRDLRAQAQRTAREEIDPVLRMIQKKGRYTGGRGFRAASFDFQGETFRTWLPSVFTDCRKAPSSASIDSYQCETPWRTAGLTINRFSVKDGKSLLKLNGHRVLDPKPLGLVDQLKAEGIWDSVNRRLSAGQLRRLHSNPRKASCAPWSTKMPGGSFFLEKTPSCRFKVDNDFEPDALSSSIWIQRGPYVYEFWMWMADAALAPYFERIPTVAILAARSDAPTPLRRPAQQEATELPPVPSPTVSPPSPTASPPSSAASPAPEAESIEIPFSIDLAQDYKFDSSNSLNGDGHGYSYKKELATEGEPVNATVFTVNVLAGSYPENNLPQTSDVFFRATLKGYKVTFDEKKVRMESIRVDGMPGLVKTTNVTRDGRSLLVFHATLLSSKNTYMVFGVTDAQSASTTLSEFMNMTRSLKRLVK